MRLDRFAVRLWDVRAGLLILEGFASHDLRGRRKDLGPCVLGTNLYDHFGSFTVCVIAITVVYTLILPVLLLVPRRLIDTADGQTPKVAFTAD